MRSHLVSAALRAGLKRSLVRIVAACLGGCGATLAAEAADPAPEVSVSLRGVLGGAIDTGEPLLVGVRVDGPEESASPLAVTPASGTWANAVAVELRSKASVAVVARGRLVPASVTEGSILDAERSLEGLWWFSADDLGALRPDAYAVHAILTVRDGTGWRGVVEAPPADLQVTAASQDPDRVVQRTLARAAAARLENQPARAVEILDEFLRADAGSISVLVARADTALELDDISAAAICMRRACELDALRGGEPSVALHTLMIRIRHALASPEFADAPRSATLPAKVLEPVRRPDTAESLPSADANDRGTQPAVVSLAPPPAATSAPGTTSAGPGADASVPVGSIPGVVVPASELNDANVTADPEGQWAVAALASSQYGKTQYSPFQATGAPNVPMVGNSPDSWCPANKNNGTDWLEISFANPVHATEVRIRQNDTVGAIAKIEAIDEGETAHLWWEGKDPYIPPTTRDIAWFAVRVPRTDYRVAKVKITLNLAAVPGWKEIDAVQLVGARE